MSLLARSNRSHLAEWLRTVDRPILIAALILVCFGLVLSLAAGPVAADRLDIANRFHFVLRQAIFASAALVVLLVTSSLSPVSARRLSAVVFLVAFLLMALILAHGFEAKGSQRWLRVGPISLQPSELVKPALVVLAAWLLAQREAFPGGPWIVSALTLFIATLGLLILQPDVGQSALLTAAFLITFFISGLPMRLAALFAAGGAVLAASLYATMPHVRYRVQTFFDPANEAYQTQKALEAQLRGGLTGVGAGEGEIKRSIPDAHTDFIYSVAVEEFGLLGGLALMAVFLFIAVRGVLAAARVNDPYMRAAATGLFALFALQAAINLAVNVDLLPPKGMTLPFVSSGGSSLIGSAFTLGLALALIRPTPPRPGRRIYV